MKPVVDAAFRMLYRTAYRAMKVYWRLRRPNTHGALVALWHDGCILLIRNSYAPYMSLPGGYVRTGETARDAAVRELAEEVGVTIAPERLVPALDKTHAWEGKNDHVEIFTLEVAEAPRIAIDNREVVFAGFFTPAQARQRDLFPPIFDAIAAYESARP